VDPAIARQSSRGHRAHIRLLCAAPPQDETAHSWQHPDGVLLEITKHGIGGFAP